MPVGQRFGSSGRGFTLVELLLVVSLVLLLVGAMVFNFGNLQKGAELEEGAAQFEALLHFVRAQAATQGRRIEIRVDSNSSPTNGPATLAGSLQVRWEPDPVAKPGWFEPFREAESYVRQISSLVSLDSIRPGENESSSSANGAGSGTGGNSSSSGSAAGDQDDLAEDGSGFVLFYPDGSSDSAEFRLAALESDDARLALVRLQGITGVIRREMITDERRALLLESDAPSEVRTKPQGPVPAATGR